MRTEFMGYLKGKTVAEMVHGFMDVNKHCNNTSEEMSKSRSKVSKCVQSLILFFSMLVSFQPSKNHHHQFLHPLHHCWKSPLSEFASRKKRCPVLFHANCQSAMQGRKCPTDVVHPLTYGEETDRVIPVSVVGTIVLLKWFRFSNW